MSQKEKLFAAGFDASYYNVTLKCWDVRCSKCLAPKLVKDVPQHELECPNRVKVIARQGKDKARRKRAER